MNSLNKIIKICCLSLICTLLVNFSFDKQSFAMVKSTKINLVWQPLVDNANDLSQLNKIEGVNVVSPSWFIIDTADGHIQDNSDFLYARDVKAKGYKLWPLITNNFDPEMTHKWLHDEASKAYIIRQLVYYAQRYPIDGYNFDFENIYDTDRDALSAFVEESTKALHKEHLTVSMDITVKSQMANWSSCYDRKRLGKALDYVILMAYDEHGRLSKTAGSVASLKWVEDGVQSLRQEVPAQKIILGVPLYTRLWQEDNKGNVVAQTLNMPKTEEIIKQKNINPTWLPVSGQYYFAYKEKGYTYKVWQENAKSLRLKVALVNKYNLAGVAAWRKGFETPDIWQAINEEIE